jgi:hypothetical protein
MVKVTTKTTGGQRAIKYLEHCLAEAKTEVKIGILGKSYPDGGDTPAMVAARHEFGGKKIPQRSFLRSTLAEKHKEWAEEAGFFLKANPGNFRGALTYAGERATKDVTDKITWGIFPPLHPQTVAAKRRFGHQEPDLPLVKTGVMLEALGYQVDGEEAVCPNAGKK